LSRQNNKTLLKHIIWFHATGKMSKWLEQRLEWDTETRNMLLESLFPHDQYHDLYQQFNQYILSNPRSAVQLIGLTVPEGM
jgi:hypothetical protein